MRQLRAYLNRIQGRLMLAFASGFASTLTVYLVATYSLDEFTDQVTERLDASHQRTGLAMRFEAAVQDQIGTGQRYLVRLWAAVAAEFDTLNVRARGLFDAYTGAGVRRDRRRRRAGQRIGGARRGGGRGKPERGLVEQNVHAVAATAESHAASAQEVSAAAEEQSAATEELSAASIELLQAADRLKELVSGFRT